MSGITHRYDFDRHLAVAQRLEILAWDVLFSLAAETVKQAAASYGTKTKKTATDVKGMLIFGAASVMYGSDRAAAAELRYAWHRLAPMLRRAGVEVSDRAPDEAAWQYFRRTYLSDPDLIEQLWELVRETSLGMALEMGIFPEPSTEHRWLHPDHLATVYADGTWVKPASSVGIKRGRVVHKSRSTTGRPRLSDDVDTSGRNHGYQHTVILARRPEKRMQLILDVRRAAPSRDVKVAIESVLRLRSRLGDRLRHFAYDRALSSHDDITRVMRAGILPLTKPGNVDAFDDWKQLKGRRIRLDRKQKKAIPFDYRFDDGCFHHLAIDAGMLWDMNNAGGVLYYGKRAEHREIRRVDRADGSYDFEIDMRLHCRRSGDHDFTWSLTGEVPRLNHRRPLRLATHLRPFPIAETKVSGPALTVRQNAESNFKRMKDFLGLGRRARSFKALDHEIDLLLVTIAHNALVWAEYQQRYQEKPKAA